MHATKRNVLVRDQGDNVSHALPDNTGTPEEIEDPQSISKRGATDRGLRSKDATRDINASMEIYGNQLFKGSAHELHQKATRIQSAYRGYAVRKSMGEGRGLGRTCGTQASRLQEPYMCHGQSDGENSDAMEDQESYYSASGEGE